MSAASKPNKGPKGSRSSKKERLEEPSTSAPETSDSKRPPDSDSETPYRGESPGGHADKSPATIWQRAIARWVAITAVLAAWLVIYTFHPYYKGQQFQPFKTVFPPGFVLWLAFGLFYVKATVEKFSDRRFVMRDSGLHFLLLARAFQKRRFWRAAKNRRLKTTLLAMVVKAFFTPLMTGFVTGHINSISRAWLTHKHLAPIELKVQHGSGIVTAVQAWWSQVAVRLPDLAPSGHDFAAFVQPWTWTRADYSWGLGLTYDMIFAVDCGFALVGYASESRWLGNKTRSVEPTAFGWLVCISCYPPFNNVLGTYLPLENGPQLVTGEVAQLALRTATVLLFSIYASATVAFGMKFSNLTHRGIVWRGPYRYIRHPAYLTKCTAWWLENVPTMTPTKAVFLCMLCSWYGLRAWTEERHLSMDPEYLAYKKKVPWVVFPGIY